MALPTALRETASSARLVFANPDLRRVNLALAGSMVGDWAFATAVTVWAYQFGGAAAVGAYAVVRLLLIAFSLPFVSVLVDRLPYKLFLVTADLIRAVLVGTCALIVWLGGPPVVVLVLAVVAGLVGAPFRPAQLALTPSLAKTPHELTAANAVGSTIESLAFFVGPAVAGLLLGVADASAIFLLDALTFVWSAALLSRLPAGRTKADEETPSERPRMLAEATAGFRVIAGERSLLLVAVLYCVQTIVAGASVVFAVLIAVDIVRIGPEGVGYLDAVLGAGAIIGGLLALSRAGRRSVGRDFGAGVVGWALPLLLVSVWPSPVVAFAAFAIVGLANPLVDVNAMTLVQRLAPASVLGRVFGALESALIGTMALGALLMPLLVELVGLRWGLTILAVPVLVATLACFPALARIDRTVSAPEQLALVTGLPIFQPLAPGVLEQLARRLTPVEVPAGRTVITAGEPGDRFYLIERGRLDARRGDEVLSTMTAGDCFGEIALLRDVPRTATVVATEDTVLQALEREDFLAAVGADPDATGRANTLVNRRLAR
jgi:MFS family permease